MMPKKAPVFFISHGAPTFAIEPDELSDYLTRLGQMLTGVNAVLVVSPHWQTRGLQVMTTQHLETTHDFSGFPQALYQLQYPTHGHLDLAEATMALLESFGLEAEAESSRGLDHGAWVPLMYLLPDANIPVFQVSMPKDLNAASALKLGAALSGMREKGVLIIGSGGLTHNLYEISPKDSKPASYIEPFVSWMREAVIARDFEKLANYRQLAPNAARAHPTDEHLLPLMVAIGATAEDEKPKVVHGDIYYSMLAMESYFWGL